MSFLPCFVIDLRGSLLSCKTPVVLFTITSRNSEPGDYSSDRSLSYLMFRLFSMMVRHDDFKKYFSIISVSLLFSQSRRRVTERWGWVVHVLSLIYGVSLMLFNQRQKESEREQKKAFGAEDWTTEKAAFGCLNHLFPAASQVFHDVTGVFCVTHLVSFLSLVACILDTFLAIISGVHCIAAFLFVKLPWSLMEKRLFWWREDGKICVDWCHLNNI